MILEVTEGEGSSGTPRCSGRPPALIMSNVVVTVASTVDPDIASTYGKRQYQVDQKDIPLKRMIAGGLSSNLIRYIAIYAYYSSR